MIKITDHPRALALALSLSMAAPTVFAPSPAAAEPQSQQDMAADRMQSDRMQSDRMQSERMQSDRMQSRRQARAASGDRASDQTEAETQQPAAAPRFPQAKRVEPEARASAKRTAELKTMFEAFNNKDAANVMSIADKLIADPDANAYEKSVSARLAGASQLNVDNSKALRYLQQAIEFGGLNNNEHFEAMSLTAQLHLQQQQYAESLAAVDRFLTESASQTPEALALKGNALYRLKRYPEAEAALKQALATSQQPQPEWEQLLIGTYAEMGKPEEAARLAERQGAAGAGDKQSQLNLAATYMQTGQDGKASEILEKLRSSGQLTEAQDYKNLIAIYSNAGDKEQQVIQIVNEGLEKNILKPDHQVYVALAQAYYFSDQPQQAIEAFQKGAPLAPNGETYLNLARALVNEGRTEEAKEAAKQALAKGVEKTEDANKIIAGN